MHLHPYVEVSHLIGSGLCLLNKITLAMATLAVSALMQLCTDWKRLGPRLPQPFIQTRQDTRYFEGLGQQITVNRCSATSRPATPA